MKQYLQCEGQLSISILLPDLRGGGAERVCVDLAFEFARLGHEVEFVLMKADGEFLSSMKRHFKVIDLGVSRVRQVPRVFSRYLRDHQPNAVFANMWPLTVVAPIAAKFAGFCGRVVVAEHCCLSKQYGAQGKVHNLALKISTALGYRLATALVGVSQGVADDMAKLSGLPHERFVVVHNPIRSLPRPSDHQLSKVEKLWGNGGPRLLTVGSLKSVKNHALLLHAFVDLDISKRSRLMILGQGENEAMLRLMASQLGIDDRVIFAGFHEDPAAFYYTADLFVLSSDYEGFGNVIVEAMACGLPVVSTNSCGPSEILEEGRHGRLVPVGDTKALTMAITEALATPFDREALICRADNFAPEIAAQRYLSLLKCS